MTIINPKSISGITSITTASGADNLLTVHTNNTTERIRINNDGDVIVGSGITVSPDGDIFATGVTTATTFSGSGASLTNLPAANITGTLPAISGANLTNLDASDLASGTVPTARLGSGTASSSTFLRGDSTFAAVTSTTINNNGDNKVITGSGTADTLNAEGNVYIDAQGDLGLGISDITPTASSYNGATLQLHQTTTGSYGSQIKMTTASGGYGSGDGFYIAHWGGNNSTYIYNKENAPIYFGTNATERATIDEHLTISDGNLVIGTSGHGIDFSATSDASGSSSELLDDYEEGSWTPTVGGWDTFTPYSGSSYYYGWYIKVGNMVHVGWKIYYQNLTTASSSNPHIRISGLPYNSNSTSAGPVGHVRFDIPEFGNTGYPLVYLAGNSDILYMYKHINNANNLEVINATSNYSNGWTMGTATYWTV